MEKHNTDDLFKKLLDNPPPMRPDMEALEDMNRRLEEVEEKRRKVLPLWLFPLLLLPFLLSSIFFYWKYDNAQKTINEINSYSTKQQIDTLTQRITIYQYDTIVNTVYQQEIVKVPRVEKAPLPVLAGNAFSTSLFQNIGFGKTTPSFSGANFNTFDVSSLQPPQLGLLKDGEVLSLGGIKHSLQKAVLSVKEEDMEAGTITYNWDIIRQLEVLSFLDNRFDYEHRLPPSEHFFALTAKSSNRINPLGYLVPTDFEIGLNWSPLGLASLPGSSNSVKTIGFLGEVTFTKNTRLQFGVDYLSVPLKAETPAEVAVFPSVAPLDPSDFFKEIYGDFTYLQVPLTFKYVFQPEEKWQPSIGVGMIARLPLKEQLRYEFLSVQGGEYTQNQSFNDDSFSINNLRGTVGLDYRFYKNYTIHAEGFYNYQLGAATNPYFQLRYGGVTIGLKYKFK